MHPMRPILCGFCVAAFACAPAAWADPLPERAQTIVEYRIDVKLDAGSKQLIGREHIVWKNPSTDAVSDLWFHLYLNAFKNTRTTFVRESGGQLRGDQMTRDSWGWIDVTSMRLADGRSLLG